MDDRFIGSLAPFRQPRYYHPDFIGNFSLKWLLPALFPDDATPDYKALHIRAGDMASINYVDLDRVDDPSERRKIRASLLEYRKPDTLAMAMIWRAASDIVEMS